MTGKPAFALTALLAVLSLVLVPAAAVALEKPPPVTPRMPLAGKLDAAPVKEGETIRVIGFDHRPRVVYVLSRNRGARYLEPAPLQKSFTQRIIQSVKTRSL